MKPDDIIPDEILDTIADGFGIEPLPFREHLGTAPTLLLFLRHFG